MPSSVYGDRLDARCDPDERVSRLWVPSDWLSLRRADADGVSTTRSTRTVGFDDVPKLGYESITQLP